MCFENYIKKNAMANDKFVMPLYFKDLNETTKDWFDEEFGAYVRLLIHQWSQGVVPEEMKRLVKIAESAEKNWHVIGKKFSKTKNGLQNKRLEEIRAEKNAFNLKQKINGKRGGRPRKNKPNQNPDLTQTISQQQTQTEPLIRSSSSISSSNQEKKENGIYPALTEVETYFTENGFSKELAKRFFNGYSVTNWIDAGGNQILNWKQKAQQVWFKDENKKYTSTGTGSKFPDYYDPKLETELGKGSDLKQLDKYYQHLRALGFRKVNNEWQKAPTP